MILDAEAHVWLAGVTPAGSGRFVGADLVASDLSRRRIRPLGFAKHMIDDPPGEPRRTPGNTGRKWPPFPRGFLTYLRPDSQNTQATNTAQTKTTRLTRVIAPSATA